MRTTGQLFILLIGLAITSCTIRTASLQQIDKRLERLDRERDKLKRTTDPIDRTKIDIDISEILLSLVGDAVKSGSCLGHALLDESADLIGHRKLLEWFLRHRRLLVPWTTLHPKQICCRRAPCSCGPVRASARLRLSSPD